MKKFMLLVCLASLTPMAKAQVSLDSARRDPEYVKTIISRSGKIVDQLDLESVSVRQDILYIIANRYFELGDIDRQYQKDKNAHYAELYLHHFEFPASLAAYLSDTQIEKVKDGMTYNVVPKTVKAYKEMIPALKDTEQLQILNWLKEARELAIDAGDSKSKHDWFGKYKGRINNWLSKRGYDLNAEREAWYKVINAKTK